MVSKLGQAAMWIVAYDTLSTCTCVSADLGARWALCLGTLLHSECMLHKQNPQL